MAQTGQGQDGWWHGGNSLRVADGALYAVNHDAERGHGYFLWQRLEGPEPLTDWEHYRRVWRQWLDEDSFKETARWGGFTSMTDALRSAERNARREEA
jgi:hypothetical protein